MNRYVKKSLKITAWIIGSVIGLFLLIVVLIQIPAIQNVIREKAVTYLEEKIGTKVRIDRIEIGLPKKVIIEGFYFEGQDKDTLLSGDKIAVDISLFKLMSNEVEINSVSLEGITAKISRSRDSVFNFDYIIKAFDSGKPKDTTSAPLKISVRNINLDRIKVDFNDAVTKNDLGFTLNHFDTKFRKFDLDKSDFDIPKIAMNGLKLKLRQGELVREIGENTAKVADSLAADSGFSLALGEIDFSKISIGYDNQGTKLNSGLSLNKLKAKFNKTDIRGQQILIDNFELDGLKGGFALGKVNQPKRKETEAKSAVANNPKGWDVQLKKAAITNVDFKFDDQNSAPVAKGIDYKHLDLSGVHLSAKNLKYNSEAISGRVDSFAMKDKSGVDIQEFHADFLYGPKQSYLKDFYLQTPKTLLKNELSAGYESIETLSDNLKDLEVNANLDHSKVAFSDILLFVPNLENSEPFKGNKDAILKINGKINGKVSDLYIPNLEVSGIGSTSIAASAHIIGLPDAKKAWMDFDIRKVTTTSKDIYSFVPNGTIPDNIKLPANISVSGTFKGKPDNLNADVRLNTSYGGAKIKGYFDGRKKNAEVYDAMVSLDNFNVGKLISNDSIGRFSLNAKVKGKGLDPKTAIADLNGKLVKAEFNGYTYKNLNLKGDIKNGKFNVVASMADPNLTFDMIASGNFRDKYPAAVLKLNVDMADLDKLNLHAGPMKLKGKVDADFTSTDPDNLNGTLNAYHFVIANEKDQFQLDSINVVAVSTADSNSISLKSQFLKAEVKGKYQLTKLAASIQKTISKFYNTKPVSEAREEDTGNHRLNFHLTVKNDPVLVKLLPDLTRLEPIEFRGGYNSATDSLAVSGTIPRLVYAGNTITGTAIDIHTEADSLAYIIDIDQVENQSFELYDTQLYGSVKDNKALYTLRVRDKKGKEQYLIAGNFNAKDQKSEIHLNNDGLVLNYDAWNVDPANLIRIGNGIFADKFDISREGSQLSLQSQNENTNAPLDVTFKDFEIGTITKMIQKETDDGFEVSGKIDGGVHLVDLMTNPVFTSDLTIKDLSVSRDTVGNLSIKVDNKTANTFNADVAISGYDNYVKISGTYSSTNKALNLDLNMAKLQMKSVQAFTFGALADSEGYLDGKLRIMGTTDAPKIDGDINFRDVKFKVTEINSAFTVTDEVIRFNEEGIRFDNFGLVDEEGNKLNINGKILTPDYRDYGFNLAVRANNFRAVNSTEKDNDLFYGQLYLDTRLNIKGTMDQPVVDGSLKVNDKTKMTVVLPQTDPGIVDREGVVEFIDQDHPELNENLVVNDSLVKTKFKGFDIDVNIEVDKNAELSMIIDKSNGDYLKLKGEARLNGGIDPSGKTNLTGRYELEEGSYEMSFNLIKRKFDIQKGSYLLWTGEPTTANISITAIYTANTAPIDLIGNQLDTKGPAIQNQYKQVLPFQALLKMNGELLKPEITFDIQLPDKNYGVSSDIVDASRTKLEQLRQDPNELNKQVFALLLLNRFIGENPFSSEAGSVTAESMARQSVSKLLSQQLNNLAGDLIKGFEVDFGLESTDDYTTGQRENRTDLNVAVSKKLFNDRLKVTVGSNFNLEGPQQANEQTTNIAGDVAVDYMLTRDGRYSVRAYRKDEYQVALQGQVIETGVAFVITMDYNLFRELFHRTAEEKKLIREEKRQKEKKRQAKKKAAEKPESNPTDDDSEN
ncbi:translocation/assembly module TamB domain-containing protein [Flavobacterium silvaticum]|uniref:Translocation/assembly module TamB n=1 Tax=Flavobacterium silvaticum TaxID=1852020 RepID=A0A972JEX9_9FLAO|nr:translocation/assembly module TamB domain-containing protein [Flavobacterium silvaticum]NMH27374.1 translocation/assembly module TamB [Flavobacterium silvaticum]